MLTTGDFFNAFQVFAVAQAALFLMQDDLLLERYRRFLEKKQFEWRHGWAAKPLGLCGACFSGQSGLWSGLFMFGSEAGLSPLQVGIKTLIFTSSVVLFYEIKLAWQNKQGKGQ